MHGKIPFPPYRQIWLSSNGGRQSLLSVEYSDDDANEEGSSAGSEGKSPLRTECSTLLL